MFAMRLCRVVGGHARIGRKLRNFTLYCGFGALLKATKDTVVCSAFVSFVAFVTMWFAGVLEGRGEGMAHLAKLRRC
jgi:hypothetical protein